eukprot:Ihof_evm7s212 gene=Ihof_evmTU7s212
MSGVPFKGFGTVSVHSGHTPDALYGTMVPAISLSSTYAQTAPGKPIGEHEYSRSSNPSRKALESALAALEDGEFGFAFSSGLAALTTICHLLKSGDHIVSMDDVYGGTSRYLNQVAVTFGVEVDFVDCTDVNVLKASIKPNTKMMWLETPTNPTLRILDIAACAAVAKEHNIIAVVDNTFMSSYFQRPLALGATIVMHSLTKYMNGHSDVVMGAAVTNDKDIAARLGFLHNAIGTVPGPFDCYLVHRGLKTLHLRMRQHATNAMAVATFLESSPKVDRVFYPGLASHPQHELAKKQMTGFGGMVSFTIKGGVEEATLFLQSVKIFTLAESLGAVESLAELPALMTHSGVPVAMREKLGITDTLIRLSVGIEDAEDLVNDVKQALDLSV